MATSLKHNLTSAYFNAANKLYPKKARRRIVAYVESYDDVAFWRTLLAEFETDEYYFQVMLPSATSLAKGKKMVLMNTLNTTELGKSLIACVDSDYDFLLQGKTSVSHKINSSPYIFQTYAYAIENQCLHPLAGSQCTSSRTNTGACAACRCQETFRDAQTFSAKYQVGGGFGCGTGEAGTES